MFKRLAKYIANEIKNTPVDIDEKIQERLHAMAIDKCDFDLLKEEVEKLARSDSVTLDFFRDETISIRSAVHDLAVIVDSLHDKRIDEIHFLDLVKELTYKINAYDKWKDYQKYSVDSPSFDPLNMHGDTSQCETQEENITKEAD